VIECLPKSVRAVTIGSSKLDGIAARHLKEAIEAFRQRRGRWRVATELHPRTLFEDAELAL
jgi:hypothetical protein